MKSKKGFAIIETLITTVVLVTALISIYVLFNNMLVKQKRKLYYDDPIFVVRANYIFDVFFDMLKEASGVTTYPDNVLNFEDLLFTGSETEGSREKMYIVSFSCDNEIFNDKTACRNFFYTMQLNRIYITGYDTTYMKTCENSTAYKCSTYNLLGTQTKQYMKSLPTITGPDDTNKEGYYVIFEFINNGANNVCSNDKCMRQYASIKYGGNNTVINLK